MRKLFTLRYLLAVILLFGTLYSNAQIAAWDFTGEGTTSTITTSSADFYNANLDASNLLTRGAGAAWSTGGNSFRTVGFKNDGISTANTDYFQFTLSSGVGYSLSLSTIDAKFAGTATFVASPGVTSQFAYSLDGSTFILIGTATTSTSLTLTQINLSGIAALQNLPANTTVTFRYYASGQTISGGWGFSSSAAGIYGLAIGGAISSACTNPNVYNVTGGGLYCPGGTDPVVGLDNSESGVSYQLKKDGLNIGSPIVGTGSSISFGAQTQAGFYTVLASNGACTATMSGSATITTCATPTKLVITSISPSSPVAGSLFSVTIQSQDGSGTPASVTSATDISLSINTGSGTLTGSLSGTIANGTNSITISEITYSPEESGIKIAASATAGMALTAGISNAFNVMAIAPNISSSALLFGTQTTTTIPITSWTPGNGTNRIVVARLSSTPAVAPTQGITYANNSTNFTDAANGTTGTGNKVIYNGNGSGSLTVSNLSPGTQYSLDIYEYNGTNGTANYGSAYTGTKFTLQSEPIAHSSALTASAISSFGLTLNFSSTTPTSGYIILQKTGNVAPSVIPVDGTVYTVGNVLGDGTVAAFITGNSTTSASINNLLSSTEYTFSIIPFGRNAINTETYNYYIGGTIPIVTATTQIDYFNLTNINTAATENFNSMGTSATAALPLGFKIGIDWAAGTTTTTFAGGTAATVTSGGVYNFGDGPAASATDRALGFLTTGSYPTSGTSVSTVVKLTNHTGARITSLDLSFDYEKYRNGKTAFNWTFFHGNSSSPSTPGTSGNESYTADLDNLVVNPLTTTNKTFTLTGISISNGADYYLKWTFTGVGSAANGQAIGIDNLSIIPRTPSDVTPPAISSLTPANTSVGASNSAPIRITFSEDVQKGAAGNIVIKSFDDNSVIQTIPVSSPSVTVTNSIVTVAISPLDYASNYYIEIDNGAFMDLVENDFAGIAGNATWKFSTGTSPVAGVVGKNYNFNTCSSYLVNGFKQFSVTGAQTWGCTNFGRTYSGTGISADSAIQMNGFASGNQTNEDWFISPPYDLSGSNYPQARFFSRGKFAGNSLVLKVSTNYTGNGDPSLATWTNLNGKFPATNSDIWTVSDSIDLSGYSVPNIYLAWVYTSNTLAASRWTLDDIKVSIGCTPPSNQPTGLSLTPLITSISGSFTAAASGNTATDKYLVVMSTSSTLSEQPSSATAYAKDDAIGNGTVISIDGSTSFEVTNLNPSTPYYFYIYSYTNNQTCYNLINPLKGNVSTNTPPVCDPPTIQASDLTATNVTGAGMDINYTRGNGDNILVISRINSAVNQNPINGVSYPVSTQIGTGNFVIYNGPAATFNYAGLTQNSTYHFALYEYSNTNNCYNTTALTGNFTTSCINAVNVSSLNAVANNATVSVSWINPTASCFSEVLVVASNAPITGQGSDYLGNANPAYSSATQVVYRSTGTNVVVTGLTNGVTYYFKVFTKNGSTYSSGVQVSGTPYNPASGYVYLFGNLHSHSSYSDGNKEDLSKKPIDDYKFARDAECMDFLGISEHNHSGAGMQKSNYSLGYNDANAVNGIPSASGNSIITLWGMEWGVISGGGHVVVYGFDDKLIGWEAGNYDIFCAKNDYASLFNLVNTQPNAFATLAHPDMEDYTNLAGTPYNVTADNAISGMALESGPAFSTDTTYSNFPSSLAFMDYYRTMLAKGYHLGAQMDGDNHYFTFGKQSTNRMAVLSVSKTREDLVNAIKEMRFYATNDCNVKVDYKCYSNVMGSSLVHAGAPTITINVNDPDMETIDSIHIWGGKIGDPISLVPIKSYAGTSSVTFDPSDPANVQTDNTTYYYYAVIRQADGNKIVTSPIWYTRKCITTSEESATACDRYLWNGTTYTTSGNYNYESTSENGCTNIATLHLSVNLSTSSSESVTACNAYAWNGTTYTTSGDKVHVFTSGNAAGCDSTATLHLTINNSTSGSESVTACNAYAWNGTTYTTSGDKVHVFTSGNAAGCDSTATLHLTINNSTTSSETVVACDSYTWNGTIYTRSGDYTFQSQNEQNCTNTATLHLTINNSTTTSETVIACDSYTWHGTIYTRGGDYTFQLQNEQNCTNTATLHLTINNSTTSDEYQTTCDSYVWHGTTYIQSGNYSYQSINTEGCTNTATLHLTINSKPTVTIPSVMVLPQGVNANTVYIGYSPAGTLTVSANPGGGTPFNGPSAYTYSWSTAPGLKFVGSTNKQTIKVSPSGSGNSFVILTVLITDSKGCTATASITVNVMDIRCGSKLEKVTVCVYSKGKYTSSCIASTAVQGNLNSDSYLGACTSLPITLARSNSSGTDGLSISQVPKSIGVENFNVKVSPNPSRSEFKIQVQSSSNESITIRLLDISGRVITVKNKVQRNEATVLGSNLIPGTYVAEIIQGLHRKKLILIKIN